MKEASCRAIGRHGAALLGESARVLTHCNAGSLATAGYGTALGVIYAAVEAGKSVAVFADETRPLLQGARLTAWELQRAGMLCKETQTHTIRFAPPLVIERADLEWAVEHIGRVLGG